MVTFRYTSLLNLKPGLTSEAALKYINEEQLLALQENPNQYKDELIYSNKINLNYFLNTSFFSTFKINF